MTLTDIDIVSPCQCKLLLIVSFLPDKMPEPNLYGCLECLQNKSNEEIELTRRSRQIDRWFVYRSLVKTFCFIIFLCLENWNAKKGL